MQPKLKIFVAHKLSEWLITAPVSDVLLGIGKIIVDSLSFLEYNLIIEVEEILKSTPATDDSKVWIDTTPILALAKICELNGYNEGKVVIEAYIILIQRRAVDEKTLNRLLLVVNKQQTGDIQ